MPSHRTPPASADHADAGAPWAWRRPAGWAVTVGAIAVGAFVLFMQVEVSEAGASRVCGSAFDTFVDNAGWRQWWADDLSEPDPGTRSALVRTENCPAAVNRSLAWSGAFSAIAVIAVAVTERPWRKRPRSPRPRRARLHRLGMFTTVIGSVLTAAGFAAIVVLVADADSTLFLYTDRAVVAVVGLIVLVPTVALIVIGRVLSIVSGELPPDQDDPDIAA